VVTSQEAERIRTTFPVVDCYDDFETNVTNTYVHEDRLVLDRLVDAVRFYTFPAPLVTSRPHTSLCDATRLFRFFASTANPSHSPILFDHAFVLGVTTSLGNKWLQRVGDHFIEDYSLELAGLNYRNGDPLTNPIVTYRVCEQRLVVHSIQVFGDSHKLYYPVDGPAWQLAKIHVIKSRFIFRTYITHAVGLHLHAMRCRYAALLFLNQAHPVRRLLDAFTRYGTKVNQERLYLAFGPTGAITRLVGMDTASSRSLFNRSIQATPFGTDTGLLRERVRFHYPAQSLVTGLLQETTEFVQAYLDRFYDAETLHGDPSLSAFCQYLRENVTFPYVLTASSITGLLSSLICDVITHSIVHTQEQQHGAYVDHQRRNTLLLDTPLSSDLAARVLQEALEPAGQFMAQYISHLVMYNVDQFGGDLEHYVPFPEALHYLRRVRSITNALGKDYAVEGVASSIGM
jgi:hypothetical protein